MNTVCKMRDNAMESCKYLWGYCSEYHEEIKIELRVLYEAVRRTSHFTVSFFFFRRVTFIRLITSQLRYQMFPPLVVDIFFRNLRSFLSCVFRRWSSLLLDEIYIGCRSIYFFPFLTNMDFLIILVYECTNEYTTKDRENTCRAKLVNVWSSLVYVQWKRKCMNRADFATALARAVSTHAHAASDCVTLSRYVSIFCSKL